MKYEVLLNIIDKYRNAFLSTKNITYEFPLYAIMLTYGNGSLSYSSRTCDGNVSKHAEDRLIQNYYSLEKISQKLRRGKYVKKQDILVIRFDNTGNLKNAQPCRDCASIIFNSAVIHRIYYSTNSGHINCINPTQLVQLSTPILNQIVIDFHNGKSKSKQNKYIISSSRLSLINPEKIGRSSIQKHNIGQIHKYAISQGYYGS